MGIGNWEWKEGSERFLLVVNNPFLFTSDLETLYRSKMTISIMAFNLRYDKPDPGNNAWKVRKDAVAAIIQKHQPDAIGTQEGKAHQILDLLELLPEYGSLGGDRLGTGTDERCAIFYRRERLVCLAAEDFWLSETPDTPGSITPSWGNHLPRMATRALFEVVGEERKIAIVNTHLDYNSRQAREKGAKAICARLANFNAADSFLFITGDFNAEPNSTTRNTFLEPFNDGIKLLDATANLSSRERMTYNDFSDRATIAIDTIYYDSRLKLQGVQVDTSRINGILPSDHFPVVGKFANIN